MSQNTIANEAKPTQNLALEAALISRDSGGGVPEIFKVAETEKLKLEKVLQQLQKAASREEVERIIEEYNSGLPERSMGHAVIIQPEVLEKTQLTLKKMLSGGHTWLEID